MRDEELCSELIQRIIPERRIRKIRFPDSLVVNLLMVLLLKDGRIDELKQSTEDEVLWDKLMKEYKVR